LRENESERERDFKHTQREREREKEREVDPPLSREPDAGLDPRTPGS